MEAIVPHITFVPYGTDRWRQVGLLLRVAHDGRMSIRSDVPFAIVRNAEAGLRLHSHPLVDPSVPDPFSTLRESVLAACGPWNVGSRRAVAGYFGWIDDVVAANRDLLDEKLAPYEGLFDHRDFRFSAPRPLPRAHLFAPLERGSVGTADDFVKVDIAFFPGHGRVVALLDNSGLPRKESERRRRLASVGVVVLPLEAATSCGTSGLADVLSPAGRPFWADDVLPRGALEAASYLSGEVG